MSSYWPFYFVILVISATYLLQIHHVETKRTKLNITTSCGLAPLDNELRLIAHSYNCPKDQFVKLINYTEIENERIFPSIVRVKRRMRWLENEKRHYLCTGLLIDDRTVLTPIECTGILDKGADKPLRVQVKAGGQTRFAKHNCYQRTENKAYAYRNLALLKLYKPFKLNNQVQPVCFPSQEMPKDFRGFWVQHRAWTNYVQDEMFEYSWIYSTVGSKCKTLPDPRYGDRCLDTEQGPADHKTGLDPGSVVYGYERDDCSKGNETVKQVAVAMYSKLDPRTMEGFKKGHIPFSNYDFVDLFKLKNRVAYLVRQCRDY